MIYVFKRNVSTFDKDGGKIVLKQGEPVEAKKDEFKHVPSDWYSEYSSKKEYDEAQEKKKASA